MDILAAGMDVLEERVEQFNRQYTDQAGVLPQVPTYGVDSDGFDDIEAFAEFVHDWYDIYNDPTQDLAQVDVLDLTLEF
jgi:hypothetical protein